MPGGKTFRDLIDDYTIWINYDPKNNGNDWGWTVPTTNPKDLVITQFALRMGRWSTAATIVHELAHLNGVTGATHVAEHTVKACLMQSGAGPYNAGIIGQFIKRRDVAFG